MAAGGVERDALPAGVLAGEQVALHPDALGAGRDRLRFVNQRLPRGVSAPQQFAHPLEHAGGQPLHPRVIASRLAVQLAGGAAVVTEQRGVDLRAAHHQDLPGPGGEHRLILPGAGAKQGELGVVPGRDNRDPDGKAQQRSGLRQQGADRLACFNQLREQAARQAGRLQDRRAEIALPEIEHLAGARHGEVGGELPGQPMVDQRRNKQPGMGLRQQLRVVLFQPDQLIQGVERKGADAGDLLQLARGHIPADGVHHRRGARAFPADDRIQQRTLLIHQRAIDAKGRDGDAAHRAGGQLVMDLPTAVGKALHNGLQRPLVPVAFFRRDVAGVRRCGAGDNVPLSVNGHRPHVRGAAVEDQDYVLLHSDSRNNIAEWRGAYPAYKQRASVGPVSLRLRAKPTC